MTKQSILLALALPAIANTQTVPPAAATQAVHVSNTFRFEIAAPLPRVAPLFGPEGERSWAGEHWNPEFVYPQPAQDIQGAVFRVKHGDHNSVWVNTLFDVAAGRMQYVSFIDDVVVTTVDVKVAALDATHTAVEVTYSRTALQPAADDIVRGLGSSDRDSGPDWKKAIDTSLGLH